MKINDEFSEPLSFDFPVADESMTDQQAAEDAAADYRTEQQQIRIERCANNQYRGSQ